MERLIRIEVAAGRIEGDLVVPADARGAVLFAHGSGSSRHSSRNRYVAQVIQRAGFATLLIDLLTQGEEAVDLRGGRVRFDIGLLSGRLLSATEWLQQAAETAGLRIGYFGASTGAAAALVAAAERPDGIGAIVSRGGRPDLAGSDLSRVRAPTLLIVGGEDTAVIRMNRDAFELLPGRKELTIVPGATHLFEEPGTLEEVARLAASWFSAYLAPPGQKPAGIAGYARRGA